MSTHGKEKCKAGSIPDDDDHWLPQDTLALASTVQRLGERNWMAVCRILRTIGQQPEEWYTPKKCYIHYTKQLKLVEDKLSKKRPMSRADREHIEDLLVKRLHDNRMQELLLLTQECENLKSAFDQVEDLINSGCFDEGDDLDNLTNEVERFCDMWDSNAQDVYELTPSNTYGSASPVKHKSPNTKGKSSTPVKELSSTPARSKEQDSGGDSTAGDSDNEAGNLSQVVIKKEPLHSPHTFFKPTNALASAAARQLAVGAMPGSQSPFTKLSESLDIKKEGTTFSKSTSMSSATSVTLSAPTLSKLLEMPPSVPGKLPSLPALYGNTQYVTARTSEQAAVDEKLQEKSKTESLNEDSLWQRKLKSSVDEQKRDVPLVQVKVEVDKQQDNDTPNMQSSSCSSDVKPQISAGEVKKAVDIVKQSISSQGNVENSSNSIPDAEVSSSGSNSVNLSGDSNDQVASRNAAAASVDSRSERDKKPPRTKPKRNSNERQKEPSRSSRLEDELRVLENMDTVTICSEIDNSIDTDAMESFTPLLQECVAKNENTEVLRSNAVLDITEDTVTSDITDPVSVIVTEEASSHTFKMDKVVVHASDLDLSNDFLPHAQEGPSTAGNASHNQKSLSEKQKTMPSKGKFIQFDQSALDDDDDDDIDDMEDTPLLQMMSQHSKKAANNTLVDGPGSSVNNSCETSVNVSSESRIADNHLLGGASIQESCEKSASKNFTTPKDNLASTTQERPTLQKLDSLVVDSPEAVSFLTLESSSPTRKTSQKIISLFDEEELLNNETSEAQCATPIEKTASGDSHKKHKNSDESLNSKRPNSKQASSNAASSRKIKSSVLRDQTVSSSTSRNTSRDPSERANQDGRPSHKTSTVRVKAKNVSSSTSTYQSPQSNEDSSTYLELSPNMDSSSTFDDASADGVLEKGSDAEEKKHKESVSEYVKHKQDSDRSQSSSPVGKFPGKSSKKAEAESSTLPQTQPQPLQQSTKKKNVARRGRRGGRIIPKSSSNSPESLSDSQSIESITRKTSRSGSSEANKSSPLQKVPSESSKDADSASDNDKVQTRAVSKGAPRGRRGRRGRGRISTRVQQDSVKAAKSEERELEEDTEKNDPKEYVKTKADSNRRESSDRESVAKVAKEEIESDPEDAYERKKGKSFNSSDLPLIKNDMKQDVRDDDSNLSLPVSPMTTDDLFKVKDGKDSLYNKQWSPQSSGPASQSMVTPTTSDRESSDESSDDSDESVRTAHSNENSGKTVPKVKRMRKDRDAQYQYKRWKKSICMIWREASYHKYANVFSQKVTDDVAPGYQSIVNRPMDLTLIKRNIDSGNIMTTEEFQRDMMLMFQNAIMYNSSDHDVYQMAVEMQRDVNKLIQDYLATQLVIEDKIKEPAVPPALRAGRHVKSHSKPHQRSQASKTGKE